MRIKILFTLFCIVTILSSCQTERSLDIDKPGRDYRWLRSNVQYSSEPYPIGLFLEVFQSNQNPNDRDWLLGLVLKTMDHEIIIPDSSIFLIKTDDGSIIELTSIDYESNIKNYYYTILPIRWFATSFLGNTHNTTTVWYPITETQLKEITNNNVTKIRIETFEALNDKNIISNYFSRYIKEQYNLMLEKLSVEKDIYSDF